MDGEIPGISGRKDSKIFRHLGKENAEDSFTVHVLITEHYFLTKRHRTPAPSERDFDANCIAAPGSSLPAWRLRRDVRAKR
jgi:hypothetical protein